MKILIKKSFIELWPQALLLPVQSQIVIHPGWQVDNHDYQPQLEDGWW